MIRPMGALGRIFSGRLGRKCRPPCILPRPTSYSVRSLQEVSSACRHFGGKNSLRRKWQTRSRRESLRKATCWRAGKARDSHRSEQRGDTVIYFVTTPKKAAVSRRRLRHTVKRKKIEEEYSQQQLDDTFNAVEWRDQAAVMKHSIRDADEDTLREGLKRRARTI